MDDDRASGIAKAVEAASRWEHGASRKPLDAVERLAGATHEDPAAREALEDALARLLEAEPSTLAGKAFACRLLWRIGTDRSVPDLAKLLRRDDTAEMAALALLPSRSPAAARAAREALEAPAGRALRAAVELSGERRDPEASDRLAALTAGPDAGIAVAAIGALGKVGGTRARDALTALLDGADSSRREAAAHALLRWAQDAEARGDAASAAAVRKVLDRPGTPRAVLRGARLGAERTPSR